MDLKSSRSQVGTKSKPCQLHPTYLKKNPINLCFLTDSESQNHIRANLVETSFHRDAQRLVLTCVWLCRQSWFGLVM